MKRNVIFIILMLSFVFALTSCGSPSTGNTTPSASSTTASATPSGDEAFSVSIENFSFKPAELKVPVGATVVWTNNDSTVHNIRADGISSPDMKKGDTFKFTFDKAGTYDYYCGLHPVMTARIIVE